MILLYEANRTLIYVYFLVTISFQLALKYSRQHRRNFLLLNYFYTINLLFIPTETMLFMLTRPPHFPHL